MLEKEEKSYASEIIKKSRVSGSAYTNSAGNPIMELKPGNDCKCRRMCYIKVSEENRLTVFKNFRGMSSKNEQDNYLQSLISASEVKQRRRRKPEEESNKPERGSCAELEFEEGRTRLPTDLQY
ncbi:uncharacterized protein LOC120352828 [Nilaparvata lugens]|uniref:uncharacterized protein LOC120352828 n=1 Tax=Nilaparvata lugens TaxID=108931 RepID=UPI00193E568F|nr:uncharacterized protein LOC120352828 [Nilaparvata lugens]